MRKYISIIMSVVFILQFAFVTTYADNTASLDRDNTDYEITNPYENVDWETWKTYKTQLHCHTTASDGFLKIKDAIRMYYDLDYDIVSITDHGTNNLGWDKAPQTAPLMRAIKKERTGGAYAPIEPLSKEEYESYLYGTAKTTNGSVRTNSTGMVDVLLGNELNLATPIADCHLTHYWSNYGQGLAGVYGDYETPSKYSSRDGGVVMLSHVGEYVYTDKDSDQHTGVKIDEYYVNKFARIFLDNPSGSKEYDGFVAGMGINSATDCHTRCDRILYDQILQKTIPNGVTPWGFTFSDSHNETSMNDAYTMMMIPDWSDLNNEERNVRLKECMKNGEFFSVSHYSFALELDGEPEWPQSYNDQRDVDAMSMNDTPLFTNIKVDEENDTITVSCKNADRIVWVSDGQVLKRETQNANDDGIVTFTLDLHDGELKNPVNLYVRFYITGDQGIAYSQPMVVKKAGTTFEPVDVPKTHDVSTFLRGLVTVLDWAVFKFNPVIWAFKYFALGYNPIRQVFTKY